MIKFTYYYLFQARSAEGDTVMIPDQVADNQRAYDEDKFSFPVKLQDGRKARAVLMGDAYGLWGDGGDENPVVKIVQE